jgi:hypothetical protein
MFILLFFALFSYSKIPIKEPRYLFNLVLPTFYFSYIGLDYIVNGKNLKRLIILSLILFTISSSILFSDLPSREYSKINYYYSALNKLNQLNLSSCSVMSNSWVILNYFARPSLPFPRFELIHKSIEEGQIIVLFKHIREPDYIQQDLFIKSLPIIYEDEDYIIIGQDKCLPITTFDSSYLQQLDDFIFSSFGYNINQNPCFILFHRWSFLEKTCNFINMNGFNQDQNRTFQ